MAIGLENYPNLDVSDPAKYPSGAIKDNPGDNTGTPVNALVYNDMHQFFFALLTRNGIAATGTPENAVDGYQYIQALIKEIRATLATETLAGVLEVATNSETLAGTNDQRIVTPLKLEAWFNGNFEQPWFQDAATTNWDKGGSGSVTYSISKVTYQRIGKRLTVNFSVVFDISGSTVTFLRYTFPALSSIGRAARFQIIKPVVFIAGATVNLDGKLSVNANNPLTFTLERDAASTAFVIGTNYIINGEFTVEID